MLNLRKPRQLYNCAVYFNHISDNSQQHGVVLKDLSHLV